MFSPLVERTLPAMQSKMQNKYITLTVLVLCTCGSQAEWISLPKVLRWGKPVKKQERRTERLNASLDSLPKEFFSGDLQNGSYCLLAYTEMAKYCGASSETKRMRLATLLTNCHLEAGGRHAINWHPEHRLRDASEEDIALVLQYVPLLTRACDRTGNGYDLALFRMQVDTDVRLWSNIVDLRKTVERATQVNLESERLKEKFELYATKSLAQSKEVLHLTSKLEEATQSIGSEYRDLETIDSKINATVQALAEGNKEFSSTMLNFLQQAYEQVEELGNRVQIQKEYNQLQASYTELQEELRRQSLTIASCLNSTKSVTEKSWSFFFGGDTPGIVWMGMFQDLSAAVKGWFMAPLAVTRFLQVVKKSSWFGGQTQLVVAIQAGVILFFLFLTNRVFSMIMGLVELCSPLQKHFKPCFDLSMLVLSLFLYPFKALYDRISNEPVNYNCRCGGRGREETEAQNQVMNIWNSTLEDKINTCMTQTMQGLGIAANLLDRFGELEGKCKIPLFDKIYRIEKRQIHIYQAIQKFKGKPLPLRSHQLISE